MKYRYKLAVVVPCYNSEPYLGLSLSCLERQWDDEHLQIILVNDCSSDGTLAKLEDFKLRHPQNVTVIQFNNNQGVSAARNAGIDAVDAEWVTFFDPDDALSAGGYKGLFEHNLDENVDIISFRCHISQNIDYKNFNPPALTNVDFSDIQFEGSSRDFYKSYFTNVVWLFAYRKDILTTHNIKFNEELRCYEDTLFNIELFIRENIRVRRVGAQIVYWIQREGSLSKLSKSYADSLLNSTLQAITIIEDRYVQDVTDIVILAKLEQKMKYIAGSFVPLALRSSYSAKRLLALHENLRRRGYTGPRVYARNGLKSRAYSLLMDHPQILVGTRSLVRWKLS